MAHELDMTNNRANMAFVGDVPWHGLGQELQEGATIEEWQVAAGMEWELKGRPVAYFAENEEGFRTVPGRQVLTRSDNNSPLSIVSDSYKIVQPKAVLEFYRDIVDAAGFKLNTAGLLNGGRKYWALAEIGKEARIMGQDDIKGFLLLATSCDGSMATTAAFTSVRVVCNNTLGFAMDALSDKKSVKVAHNKVFDHAAVKAQMGLAATSWDAFIGRAHALAGRRVTEAEAQSYLVKLFGDSTKSIEEHAASEARNMRVVHNLFSGDGLGSDFASANDTAWGLVNAVTEFSDHRRRARSADSRIDSSWFGEGALLKSRAWDAAIELLAA